MQQCATLCMPWRAPCEAVDHEACHLAALRSQHAVGTHLQQQPQQQCLGASGPLHLEARRPPQQQQQQQLDLMHWQQWQNQQRPPLQPPHLLQQQHQLLLLQQQPNRLMVQQLQDSSSCRDSRVPVASSDQGGSAALQVLSSSRADRPGTAHQLQQPGSAAGRDGPTLGLAAATERCSGVPSAPQPPAPASENGLHPLRLPQPSAGGQQLLPPPAALQQQQQQQQPCSDSISPEHHQQQRQQQQQRGPSASGGCVWGWWRQSGVSLWPRLDPVRLPLLQAHSQLRGSVSSSQQLLAVAGAGGRRGLPHSAAINQCWEQLLQQGRAARLGPAQQQLQQHKHQALQEPPDEAAVQQAAAADAVAARARLPAGQPGKHQASSKPAPDKQAGGNSVTAAAGGRPPAPKPPRKPWQPKMSADEPNWDQGRFTARLARAEEQLRRGTHNKYPRALPEQATATFAVLLLLHGAGWPTHLLWERWQAAHAPGSVAMLVHMKAGVTVGPGMPGLELINQRRLRTSVSSQWGDISLVQAQLDSLTEVLRRCPKAAHIALASGHDIPLQLIQPGLLMPGVSLFGSYQFADKEARTLKVAAVDELVSEASMTECEAQGWGRALIFHHQWMVLSREHALALVSLHREIMVVGRVIHRACESVKAGMAPDEFALITALRASGFVRSIQRVEVKPGMRYPPGCLLNAYPTLVLFPAESSPHPVLWTDMDEKVNCQVEKEHTGQQFFKQLSLKECLDISQDRCALFFRKVEIRQTRGEELAKLLSSLEAMWRGKKVSSGAASSGGRKAGKRGRQHNSGAKGSLARSGSGDSRALSSTPDSETEDTADEAEQPKKAKL